VRQIVSRAVASEGVVDIFEAAGLKKRDISILTEELLAEVRLNAPGPEAGAMRPHRCTARSRPAATSVPA
jgi:hypothetical protein